MLVAQDHRPPGADVIHIALAVFIGDPGPLGGGDESGLATHGSKGTHWGIDAPGDAFAGTGEKLF